MKWGLEERRDAEVLSREVYTATKPTLKTVQSVQKNHGNLWLVINVLAGGLNHSERKMAQCLTV